MPLAWNLDKTEGKTGKLALPFSLAAVRRGGRKLLINRIPSACSVSLARLFYIGESCLAHVPSPVTRQVSDGQHTPLPLSYGIPVSRNFLYHQDDDDDDKDNDNHHHNHSDNDRQRQGQGQRHRQRQRPKGAVSGVSNRLYYRDKGQSPSRRCARVVETNLCDARLPRKEARERAPEPIRSQTADAKSPGCDYSLGEFAEDAGRPFYRDLRRRPFDLVRFRASLFEHLEPGLDVQARQLLETQVRFVGGCKQYRTTLSFDIVAISQPTSNPREFLFITCKCVKVDACNDDSCRLSPDVRESVLFAIEAERAKDRAKRRSRDDT